MRKFMIQVSISVNHRMKWKCIDCRDENRRYGHSNPNQDWYLSETKKNIPLEKYKILKSK